tara:strand:+ start:242 stop:583 length:342 start_codon:yes stop_codon:yes gene_type:complete
MVPGLFLSLKLPAEFVKIILSIPKFLRSLIGFLTISIPCPSYKWYLPVDKIICFPPIYPEIISPECPSTLWLGNPLIFANLIFFSSFNFSENQPSPEPAIMAILDFISNLFFN